MVMNDKIVVIEPGYTTTPICMVQAAYVLLAERNKLPPGYVVIRHGNSSFLCVYCQMLAITSRCSVTCRLVRFAILSVE